MVHRLGAWPLADKEMIWIDEDTGITKDDYGEMTLARSDGKLEVKRAVTAETPCRVRAIMSGNVPHTQLSTYLKYSLIATQTLVHINIKVK